MTRANQREKLTDTQRSVVALVAQGLLNKQIAHQLRITEATVKSHVSSAIERAGLINRVQLAVWWVRQDMNGQVTK